MEMIITILDAEVEEKRWVMLKNTYRHETIKIPDGIYQTSLIQSRSSPTSWRIMTLWRSLEDLEKMRQSTSVPLAVMIFRKAGAKPILSIWTIATQKINMKSSFSNSL